MEQHPREDAVHERERLAERPRVLAEHLGEREVEERIARAGALLAQPGNARVAAAEIRERGVLREP